MTEGERTRQYLVYRPLPFPDIGAVQTLNHQGAATMEVKIAHLLRLIQQLRIMPRQPTKVSAIDAKLFRRGANVETMLGQRPAHEIEIKTPTSLREFRNKRHRPLLAA
jgi:hypothetical protein